jgi:hypothetical protein
MTTRKNEPSHSFVPSRVEGLDNVKEVTVYPDRLEVSVGEEVITYDFSRIARRQESPWRSFAKQVTGGDVWPKLVADRDWFHEPKDRFFVFYTEPPMKIFMPVDELEDHESSHFFRVQEVIRAGKYATFDLG